MVRLPAEWEQQSAVMLTWPHANSDWAPIMASVEKTYHTILDTLLNTIDVIVVVDPSKVNQLQQELLAYNYKPYDIHIHTIPSNDTWARDHGPICVIETQGITLLDFTFNGWGNKFEAQLDNQITRSLYQQGAFGDHVIKTLNLVLEGGAIESDGQGCLLTTRECLCNPNRNPEISQSELENTLKEQLGVHKILWLDNGYLAGDDTDSHIDTLARFAPNNTITYVKCDDSNDEHFEQLQKMEEQLQTLSNCDGTAFTLIPLPWPSAKFSEDGERLPATYANYLITNQQVLVPTYNDKNDALALQQIAKAHPEHEIVGIDCLSLIEQHGSLHCITMQIPAMS